MKYLILIFVLFYSLFSISQSGEDLYNKSLTELREKKYEQGIETLNEFIQKFSDFENIHEIYLNRANAKALINDYNGAIQDYTSAYEKNPKYAEAIRQRGFLKKENGKFSEALKDYNLAIEIDSTLGTTYINKGIVLDTIGQKKEACKCYEKALVIGLKNAASNLYHCDSNSIALKKYTYKILIDKTIDKSYGYSIENPIKVGHGPRAQKDYLELIRDARGDKLKYKRIGSAGTYQSDNAFLGLATIDSYQVKYRNKKGKKIKTTLFISFYDYEQPKIPVDLYSIDD